MAEIFAGPVSLIVAIVRFQNIVLLPANPIYGEIHIPPIVRPDTKYEM
jgi:hypothetical protein